jgi:DNA-binding transcriptional regulator YdaS (Cro superfamily)
MDTQITKTPIGLDALQKAIDQVGLIELARKTGLSYQLIQGWLVSTRKWATPSEYVAKISEATGGAVSKAELRPDIFGFTEKAA